MSYESTEGVAPWEGIESEEGLELPRTNHQVAPLTQDSLVAVQGTRAMGTGHL